jgi:hypothetical protein
MQNPLGVVSRVDLTPHGTVLGHGTGVSGHWLGGAQGRGSGRAWERKVGPAGVFDLTSDHWHARVVGSH